MALDFITTDEQTGKHTRHIYPDQGLVGQTVAEAAGVINSFMHMPPEDARYAVGLFEHLMYGPEGQATRDSKGSPNVYSLLIHLRAMCALRGGPGEAPYCIDTPIEVEDFGQFQAEEAMREYK